MRIPTQILLEPYETPKSLLFSVFRTLHLVLQGFRPAGKAIETLFGPEAEIVSYNSSTSSSSAQVASLTHEEELSLFSSRVIPPSRMRFLTYEYSYNPYTHRMYPYLVFSIVLFMFPNLTGAASGERPRSAH